MEKRPVVQRTVIIGLFFSLFALGLVTGYWDPSSILSPILLALLFAYWLGAIYTYLPSDRSALRTHMPALGRKAIAWFVIVISFLLAGAFMLYFRLDGSWKMGRGAEIASPEELRSSQRRGRSQSKQAPRRKLKS